ncbi:30S ribosome-binding factor RbfA [Helicobacter saguini]|uniref:30S ribosome-binding factor RbfA n=1 Tax=Helicobacter saguini TaxID=1548018 RepID=A0A347VS69_9HELI|nr:30S ribosome-binding factor RbfA [Helicobacter saguini]MWV62630.1 30S ribosome-binding factor RbfA [Helicobacter saguini]MWV66698.1 30S ribosome-binding factor RbfA [Helicobacter saguini]MWV69048.1 30S ribosome-binding factor RbfA [Helicobacter saguini]MWV71398.1 30S ribosome-binding factor RbfA [Helicobacter saguini]TLD94028.1 30S ribosome-binding factor RbfA [Helicobacter saguini]
MRDRTKILQARKEAFLLEIISGAMTNLDDDRLNTLEIIAVKCSKGKHDAKIFVNASDITKQEQTQILNAFNKAKHLLKEYVLSATSWYHSPNFTLVFDDSLQIQNRLDDIFKQIHAKDSKGN